ncbi:MAG: hypothetical protein WCZ23_10155 [Rhodospirillaceae bacterium]
MTQILHGRLWLALILGVPLVACAGPPPTAGAVRVDGASLSQPMPRPGATAPADPAVAALPVPAPTRGPSPTARSGVKPGAIINRPGATVQDLLGVPDLRRREPPAEVWQYAGDSCVLDITFYAAKDGGAAVAAYLESRALDGGKMEPAACLGHLGPRGD